jgi:hypothetical protein
MGCAHKAAEDPRIERLSGGNPAPDLLVETAMKEEKNESTRFALEQGFALLRELDGEKDAARRATHFLERGHSTFDDLKDPDNIHLAFAADVDKPYRGRPHERVMTALTLAVLDMARGRCDLARPTLRSAEYLDARWQPFPFGTDAPLVYALMLRCAHITKAAASDVQRAREGLFLSLRLMLALEPALALTRKSVHFVPRRGALATRLAALLMEIGVPAALITKSRDRAPSAILKNAGAAAGGFLKKMDDELERPDVQAAIRRVADASEGGLFLDVDAVKKAARERVAPELGRLSRAMVLAFENGDADALAFAEALKKADALTERIAQEAKRDVFVVTLSGYGPDVVREGSYDEVAVIKPSVNGTTRAEVRRMDPLYLTEGVERSCGLHPGRGGSVVAVLCSPPGQTGSDAPRRIAWEAADTGLELWSSSYQATSVVGRRFDRILEGRAQFKAGAENVAEVATFSAWILFRVGVEIFGECLSEADDARVAGVCATIALAIFGVALLTVGFAATIWGIGAAVNAEADGRYVHNIFESGTLLLFSQKDPSPQEPAAQDPTDKNPAAPEPAPIQDDK